MDPSKETTEAVFKVLKADKPNQSCWDCRTRQPTWCSTTFGVYICLDCSSVHRNMGVHISFVQSSTLDSWQLKHIRTMKVGGNRSATDFYTRNGAATLLSDTDTKKKYSGRVADLYREELARRVQQDVSSYPNGIFVEGADEPAAPAPAADDDDFFSNWDKPAKPSASPKPINTTAAPPPKVGVKPTPPANPRTVTSASLRSNSSASSTSAPTSSSIRTSKGPTRLGAVSTASSTSARPAKLGLGAKKAVSGINFEEAEAKARAEEERAKELEQAQRDAEEEKARRAAASAATPIHLSTPAASTSTSATSVPSSAAKSAGSQDVERLGIGFKRLGFGSTAAPSPAARKATSEDAPTTAREKFGNQKAISSDMYFDRGTYDPSAVSEARTKLAQFQGATSISSNQYFGREEGDEEEGEGADGSFTGNESLSALEAATRDAVSRVLARDDVQNAAETIRAGALKLSDYLAQLQ